MAESCIVQLVGEVDELGIDVPLGWPIPFAEAVALHSETGRWRTDHSHEDTTALRLRRTALWVWEEFSPGPWPPAQAGGQ